ncbi:MAG TPA: type II secretion system protein GspE, partial [Candidatus Binatia bacterium]|nr:type II secretion system protein GspE [Candidatus Binatia bacterium]
MSSAREAAAACGLPFAEAPPRLPPRELLASLPMQYARRHLVLPLGRGPHGLEVAMADPAALAPLDDLRLLYG